MALERSSLRRGLSLTWAAAVVVASPVIAQSNLNNPGSKGMKNTGTDTTGQLPQGKCTPPANNPPAPSNAALLQAFVNHLEQPSVEGNLATMYIDSVGLPTVGIGDNLKANPVEPPCQSKGQKACCSSPPGCTSSSDFVIASNPQCTGSTTPATQQQVQNVQNQLTKDYDSNPGWCGQPKPKGGKCPAGSTWSAGKNACAVNATLGATGKASCPAGYKTHTYPSGHYQNDNCVQSGPKGCTAYVCETTGANQTSETWATNYSNGVLTQMQKDFGASWNTFPETAQLALMDIDYNAGHLSSTVIKDAKNGQWGEVERLSGAGTGNGPRDVWRRQQFDKAKPNCS
jgi:GH24 family phage-related lysozyme (muramidase)